MGSDGIKKLIVSTQLKSENANDQAMAGAVQKQALIKQQEILRPTQKAFDEKVKDGSDIPSTKSAWNAKAAAFGTESAVSKPADYLGRYSKSGIGTSSKFSPIGLAKNLDVVASSPARFAAGIKAFAEIFKKALEESSKKPEGQDKMGNFEIQHLMQAFNQAETLSASVKKKKDDQLSSVIGKLG